MIFLDTIIEIFPKFQKNLIIPGTCPVVEVWDDLRLRHSQIAVYGDVHTLKDQSSTVVASASERVIVRFPCLTDDTSWHFYEGDPDLQTFRSVARDHPFQEYIAENVC